jgi:hypothetical protein
MSTDGVSERQFYDALQRLEERLGAKIDAARDSVEQKLDAHAEDDLLVANRVLVIETQRAEERTAAMKRGVWAGIMAASGVSLVIEGMRHFWKP